MKRPKLPTAVERMLSTTQSEDDTAPTLTGRYIITFRDGASDEGRRRLEAAGFIVASADDADEGVLREEDATGADVLIFPRLDMALLSGEPEQYERVRAVDADNDPNSPILTIAPETVVSGATNWPHLQPKSDMTAYLRGYSDGVNQLTNRLVGEDLLTAHAASITDRVLDFDESRITWGLQITRVVNSRFTGRGINLAVLDSGIDLNHQDFRGRIDPRNAVSFVPSSNVEDRLGHGTHCAGIACGPVRPAQGPRYGVAPDVGIHIAKVLNDGGFGAQGWITAGIDWAVKRGCQIVSVSIEERVFSGTPFNPLYEQAGRQALQHAVLVVAAAGNHSDRRNRPARPVAAPANSPSIIAVGSVGETGRVSNFSNGGVNPNGGEVNIVAPGESIHSSFRSNSYFRDSGTSQATPFVAGIAALFAEADSTARGSRLVTLLQQVAFNIGAHPVDAGAGLVLAPT
jgi:subtilisin family serine protease